MTETILNLKQVADLAQAALQGAGANADNAAAVARSTMLAERDGIRSHGLLYVPVYAEHLRCGKVDGTATPTVEQSAAAAIRVDAQYGFAHSAIDAGWDALLRAATANGVAAMTLHHSYNCGVLGHHAERLAADGCLGLCFTHAPASIAPPGGSKPVVGTNPFAVGVPDGQGGAALVIDQSASVVAKSEILLRAREGREIEPHWAMDENGAATTDAAAALKGSMAPAGGYKGFGVGLLVELMASCLAGATLSKDASPFSGTAGGPPSTGQCFIAFDPNAFSGAVFNERVAALTAAITQQQHCRLPGDRRRANRERIERDGVAVSDDLLAKIRGYATPAR